MQLCPFFALLCLNFVCFFPNRIVHDITDVAITVLTFSYLTYLYTLPLARGYGVLLPSAEACSGPNAYPLAWLP